MTPTRYLASQSWLIVIILFPVLVPLVLAQALEFSDALYNLIERRYGSPARERVTALNHLISKNQTSDNAIKLAQVNAFFNEIEYSRDAALWDQKDYWATPFEVLGNNAADCEDYAMSKYFALISMGVPEEQLRITYVTTTLVNEVTAMNPAHMVLAYYPTPDADPLILDNMIDSILLASNRTDLTAVFSFNGSALWRAINDEDETMEERGADRLSQWIQFNSRLREQMGE